MTSQTVPPRGTVATAAAQASWLPMIIIALAQIQLSFNIGALQVSIGGIVEDFKTAPTSVSTALVVYSLAVASFVMLGAKLDKIIGSRTMFQAGVVVHGIAMGMMALSTTASRMIQVQGLAGLVAALMVPSLVVLIATHYKSRQQAQALGLLGAAQASASILAFLIAGALGTFLSWRFAFGLLVFLAIAVFIFSFRLQPVARQPGLKIDWNGVVLVAVAVTLMSLGFNYLNAWGVLLATPNAPFNLLGLSPAPVMILMGIMLGQLFFQWSHLRQKQGEPTLIALEVLDTPEERSEAQLKQSTGVPAVWGDASYTLRERVAARPTLDINGLWSGWSGPGPKTIIPAKAGARLSSRLVANQNPHKIYELLKARIEALAPPTVRVEVRLLTTGEPALIPFDLPAMQAAARAYERGWGATPTFVRGGGSIPIVADIARLMQIPVVMMGYGLDDDGLHAPNESYSLEMFQRGIETAIVYLEELAHLERQG